LWQNGNVLGNWHHNDTPSVERGDETHFSKMKIFLIGMPGSVKQTTGKIAAEKLKIDFC